MVRDFNVLAKHIKELALYTPDFKLPDVIKSDEEIQRIFKHNRYYASNTLKRVKDTDFKAFLSQTEMKKWSLKALKNEVLDLLREEYKLYEMCTNCFSVYVNYKTVGIVERMTLPDMEIVICRNCNERYHILKRRKGKTK